ncbi:MAG: TIGR04283 family arsenosugar biosynthesis glycosyltransferase [Calothrix sp. C42_A2020_038]|nr:TIGR04283 family arsenosugar biosynthesis glycosyltransferase [Calothrix sp. C42_A2020_038]
MLSISIIIPTLNEANSLEQTLRPLTVLNPPAKEVIIVDGGSTDETIAIAKYCLHFFPLNVDVQIFECGKKGRAIQMNYGAKVASGDVLCFLHADTQIPNDLVTVIDKTLANSKVACGGFISLMTGSLTTRWSISLHNYLKTYYAPLMFRPHLFFKGLRLLFGDQVMFCRRQDFFDCGGFDESLPIMEDGDLCRKLHQKGEIRLVNRVVTSSDRRVAHWGFWKATTIYLYIGILWGFGVDANYLKRFYQDIR